MKFRVCNIPGVVVFEPHVLRDHRGLFYRTFCKREFEQVVQMKEIVQMNHSLTRERGTIRGMHYQVPPASEAKLIRCVRGSVFDVAVDLRRHSATLLQWVGVELSEANRHVIYIPEGCAHGFQSLEDDTELVYCHTAFYAPEAERGLRFDDPRLSIQWPLEVSAISDKDRDHPLLPPDFEGVPG